MGYELDKLMAQFGVSSPVLPYSGNFTPESKEQYDAYKQQYLQRIQDTPIYAAPPSAAVTKHFTPPAQSQLYYQQGAPQQQPQPLSARQAAVAPGGMGLDTFNQTIKDWYRANPNATTEQVKAAQTQYGVTNKDLYGATGNYWGNTLKPPQFSTAPAPQQTVAPVEAPQAPATPGVDDISMPLKPSDLYAHGGLVRFEDGGLADLSSKYDDNDLTANPSGSPSVSIRAKPSLEDLIGRYATQPSSYAGELKAARETATKEQQAFQQMLERHIANQTDQGPSKSEMYFRLAAALGAPTRSGHFGEAMGNAAGAMADYEKDVRESQRKGEANKLALAMEAQKSRVAGSKSEVDLLRTLTGDELRGQKEVAVKLMVDYLKSGQPQSEAGKIAADKGLKPGTPEFNKDVDAQVKEKIDSGNFFKQAMLAVAQGNQSVAQAGLQLREQAQANAQAEKAKLTPSEMKMKAETELALTTMAEAYKDLKTVEELNPNTFDNSLVDQAQYKLLSASGSKDPKVVNTGVLNNILKQGALSTAATTLKTQISDADIKMLQGLQGLDAKSQQERAEIVKAAKRRMLEVYKIKKLQLQDINAGKYRTTQPAAPADIEE